MWMLIQRVLAGLGRLLRRASKRHGTRTRRARRRTIGW
jgi:hypothetical protein